MGYRAYLGKANKGEDLFSLNEDYPDDPYWEMVNVTQLHELGKYVTWRPENSENISKYPEDEECYIVDKDFLLYIIEEYRIKNNLHFLDFYERSRVLQDQTEENNISEESLTFLSEITMYLKSKAFHKWGDRYNALSLDDKGDLITNDWSYEYSIFNLIHILKTIDWDKEKLLFYCH